MRVHFTDISVRRFKPGDYSDASTPGFVLRVGKRTKTWTVMRGTSRERITIGRYPDLSLSDARTAAKALLLQSPEPKTELLAFEEAKDRFIEEHYRDKSLRTKSEAKRHLNKHFKPLFKKALPQIGDADIEPLLKKLGNRPAERLHAYRYARCFFRWCTRPPRRFIKHSPMEGYEAPSKDRKRTRILTDQELRAVWHAADGTTNRVVRLLILWGTRQGERTATAKVWLSDGVLTIPGAFTKNGRDHAIPILPMAHGGTRRCLGKEPLFLSRWGDSHLTPGAWSKIKHEIQAKSGTKNWQLRDLRRTFRSNMARLKVPRDLAEVLINHAPPVLDEIYDRCDRLEEKREALSRYETWLKTLLST